MIKVQDTLTSPFGKKLNATIKVVATRSQDTMMEKSEGEYQVKEGVVDFDLVVGEYQLLIKYSDTFEDLGKIEVTDTSADPSTLNALRIP